MKKSTFFYFLICYIFIFVVAVMVLTTTKTECNIYISKNGDDENIGDINSPFQTIDRAIEEIAIISKKRPLSKVYVNIGEGIYEFNESLCINESLKSKNTEVYFVGKENVVFSGGKYVYVKDMNDVEIFPEYMNSYAGNKIKCIDLHCKGIDEYSLIPSCGFSNDTFINSIELFYNDTCLPIARYPNNTYNKIADENDEEGFETSFIVDIDEDRLACLSEQEGGYASGFFYHDWADDTIPINMIDSSKKAICSLSETAYGVRKNARYFLFNYLSELDYPGEWYLDRNNGMLYFYPFEDMKENDFFTISFLDNSLINIENCNAISFENIIFEAGRDNLIDIKNSKDIVIKNSILRYCGKNAIEGSGENIYLLNNEIYERSFYGIKLEGGDRKNLISSKNKIINCSITKTSRTIKSVPGLYVSGVGFSIKNNYIYDLPHSAINFKGNDNIIEYNEIKNVCYATADSGAIYIGRNFTYGGNQINNNYIHDMKGNWDGTLGATPIGMGTSAIYLDDMASGIEVKGNIIKKVFRGILLGGGKSNTIKYKVIIDSLFSISADNRGENWFFEGNNKTMKDRLFDEDLDIQNSIKWLKRFPYLIDLIEQYKSDNMVMIKKPSDNVIIDNIKCNTFLENIDYSVIENGEVKESKIFTEKEMFVCCEEDQFKYKEEFKFPYKLDFAKIGKKQNAY